MLSAEKHMLYFTENEQNRPFAEFILSPFDFAQGRSQAEGEWAQDDVARRE
jgi:hypothetical protein